MKRKTPADRLADKCDGMPRSILTFAMAAPFDDLPEYFRLPTDVILFGSRLIKLVSALYCGAYIHAIDTDESASRQPQLDNLIREILFASGSSLDNTASTIINMYVSLSKENRIFPNINHKVIAEIIQSKYLRKGESSGNRLRSELLKNRSIHEIISDLLDEVAFLKEVHFDSQSVVYNNIKIILYPFFINKSEETGILHGYQKDYKDFLFTFSGPEGESRESVRPDYSSRRRLREIARTLAYEVNFDDSEDFGEDMSQPSTLSLVGDKYPNLFKLVDMLYNSSDRGTKLTLWLRPYYADDIAGRLIKYAEVQGGQCIRESRESRLKINNAIIRCCLESDPVTVLEEFFEIEAGDLDAYINHLLPDAARAAETVREIDEKVMIKHLKIRAFYESEQDISKILSSYRAKLGAIKVANLLGFDVKEHRTLDNITKYQQRLLSFREYINSRKCEIERIKDSLREAAIMTEEILQFLVTFYSSIPYYDPEAEEGFKRMDIDKIKALRSKICPDQGKGKPLGLGGLIANFKKLQVNEGINKIMKQYLDRDGIWYEKNSNVDKYFATLWELHGIRNSLAHPKNDVSTYIVVREQVQLLIDNLIEFYKWLEGNPITGEYRIFPSIVTVGVKTTNSSNMTCIRYTLNYIRGDGFRESFENTSLFTTQEIKIGECYYALPCHGRTSTEVWVDPLLVKSSYFTM